MSNLHKVCIFIFLSILPLAQVEASTSAKDLWAKKGAGSSGFYLPFDIERLGTFAVYFIHIVFLVIAIFAFMTIIKGGVGVLLSSGNYDVYTENKQIFMSGFVSLVLSLVAIFSLDMVFSYIGTLSQNFA